MVNNFHMAPMGFGPGSQETGEELEYMQMPSGMRTYTAHTPYLEDATGLEPALALMAAVADAAQACAHTGMASFDLSGLDVANRALVAETMGQGEVAMKIRGIPALMVQESVFAGIWCVAGAGVDRIEVGPAPAAAFTRAFEPYREAQGVDAPRPNGVVNAPALVAELYDKSDGFVAGGVPHTINLTLLPHTEEDLVWMDRVLGEGAVTILSRGYGNCRVTATALPHVWRVQFFNSMDTLILDTFEVTGLPEVALAADVDLQDSAERLREVLEAVK